VWVEQHISHTKKQQTNIKIEQHQKNFFHEKRKRKPSNTIGKKAGKENCIKKENQEKLFV
jgi:hypothetical protein